jgi:hypothetical protein
LLKDAGRFFKAETQRIRDHIVSLAAAAERPVEHLAGASVTVHTLAVRRRQEGADG